MSQMFIILISLHIFFVSSLQQNNSFLSTNISIVSDVSLLVVENQENHIPIRVKWKSSIEVCWYMLLRTYYLSLISLVEPQVFRETYNEHFLSNKVRSAQAEDNFSLCECNKPRISQCFMHNNQQVFVTPSKVTVLSTLVRVKLRLDNFYPGAGQILLVELRREYWSANTPPRQTACPCYYMRCHHCMGKEEGKARISN